MSPCRVTAEVGAFQRSSQLDSGSTRTTSRFMALLQCQAHPRALSQADGSTQIEALRAQTGAASLQDAKPQPSGTNELRGLELWLQRKVRVQPAGRYGAGQRSVQRADLFLGHDALDVLGLALDTIAPAAVRFDRQAADDGIDAALLDHGAALRALLLVVDIVVNRVTMRHRLLPLK